MELIVGDIEDEHDLASAAMIEQSGAVIPGSPMRAPIWRRGSQALGIDLTSDDLAEDVDTLGGLIVTLAGRVPARSELIAGPEGLEFEIPMPIHAGSSGCGCHRRRIRAPNIAPLARDGA